MLFFEMVGVVTWVGFATAWVVSPMTAAFPLKVPASVGINPTIIGAPPVGDWLTRRAPAVAVIGVDCVCAGTENFELYKQI